MIRIRSRNQSTDSEREKKKGREGSTLLHAHTLRRLARVLLRQRDFEDAVLEDRIRLRWNDLLGQPDLALEAPDQALRCEDLLCLRLLTFALPAYVQAPVPRLDLHVLTVHTGQLHVHDEFLARVADLDRRGAGPLKRPPPAAPPPP